MSIGWDGVTWHRVAWDGDADAHANGIYIHTTHGLGMTARVDDTMRCGAMRCDAMVDIMYGTCTYGWMVGVVLLPMCTCVYRCVYIHVHTDVRVPMCMYVWPARDRVLIFLFSFLPLGRGTGGSEVRRGYGAVRWRGERAAGWLAGWLTSPPYLLAGRHEKVYG